MSILKSIGLTKEAIAKLLGIKHQATDKPEVKVIRRKKSRNGRKSWSVSDKVVKLVRSEDPSKTLDEVARKYKVSIYWVWAIRHNKIRKSV